MSIFCLSLANCLLFFFIPVPVLFVSAYLYVFFGLIFPFFQLVSLYFSVSIFFSAFVCLSACLSVCLSVHLFVQKQSDGPQCNALDVGHGRLWCPMDKVCVLHHEETQEYNVKTLQKYRDTFLLGCALHHGETQEYRMPLISLCSYVM